MTLFKPQRRHCPSTQQGHCPAPVFIFCRGTCSPLNLLSAPIFPEKNLPGVFWDYCPYPPWSPWLKEPYSPSPTVCLLTCSTELERVAKQLHAWPTFVFLRRTDTQLLWELHPGPSTPSQSSGFSLNCATEPLSDSRCPVVPKNTGELDSCEARITFHFLSIFSIPGLCNLSSVHDDCLPGAPLQPLITQFSSFLPTKQERRWQGRTSSTPQCQASPRYVFIAAPCSSSLSVPNPSSFLYCSSLRRVILLDSYQATLLKTEQSFHLPRLDSCTNVQHLKTPLTQTRWTCAHSIPLVQDTVGMQFNYYQHSARVCLSSCPLMFPVVLKIRIVLRLETPSWAPSCS